MFSDYYSLRCKGGNGDLFQKTFLDSEIAKPFALSAGKISDIIHHDMWN